MKLLSLGDFKTFSFDQKCDVVTIYSNYIAHREFPNGKAYLYHTGSFFIEVVYSSALRKIQMIHAFDNLEHLQAYTETISLADLSL